MFHSRCANNRINRLHERSLRITYNDYESTFQELLYKDNSVRIHQRNLQLLAILVYKVKNNLAADITYDIFNPNQSYYNLRNNNIFQRKNVRTVRYGTESLSFLAPKIWALLPDEIIKAETLDIFKERIKNWETDECPCRLCKSYIPNLGFL